MMMMRTTTFILSLLLPSVSAAPAIVWKSLSDSSISSLQGEKNAVHNSNEMKAPDLLNELNSGLSDHVSVVFLLGRGTTGSESLTTTAPLLQKVSEKYDSASFIHHHVSGIESGSRFVSDAVKRLPERSPLLLNLQELEFKLNETEDASSSVEMDATGGVLSKREFKQTKRSQALANANVLVVDVAPDTSPETLDSAIIRAIEHAKVDTVVLSAVRGVDEVKQERNMAAKRRWLAQQKATSATPEGLGVASPGHRRLDDAAAEGDAQQNANGNAAAAMSGVYYVTMTPNILAGILFFGMFVVVTWIGISCMGMISGQEVYVSKMPSIGREA